MSALQSSLPEAMRTAAEQFAGAPVIVCGDRSVSFRECDARSDAVAAWLAARGVARGDRVGLYCINCEQFTIAYAGIVKAGATVVPVNLLLNPKEVAFVLVDAGVKGLIYHEAMVSGVKALRGAVPTLEFMVSIGQERTDEADVAFRELEGWPATAPDLAFQPDEDLVAILYTSGTTGRPKGAMLTHRNLIANTRSVRSALQLQPTEDRLLVVLPMFHSFAATVGMLTPLLHGLTMVLVPRFEPSLVSAAIAAASATVFLGVPSMYNALLRLPDAEIAAWRSVRFGVAGGAAMPLAVMRRFEQRFGFPILEGDGPTECSPVTCVNPLAGTRKPASVGLPVPDVEIAVFDDAGGVRPPGEIGEICVRGPNVMRGYWGLPAETAETFFGDWLRTGDLGYLDADGYVFLVDRKKDMIIVNGMNVYPRMIEEVLYRHPGIVEAAVVGEPHDSHGEIPVAYVVTGEGETPDTLAIRAWCRDHLGRHEVPRKVFLVATLPKNAAGKVLKRELRRSGERERGIDQGQAEG